MSTLRRLLLAVVAGAVLAGLSAGAAGAAPVRRAAQATPLFTIDDPRITESSGLAVSAVHKGILYTINDSSGEARIYALDRDGDVVASLLMRLVYNRDWEAVAAGPNQRIWVGDIGDNNRNQGSVTLYRFREPRTLQDQALYWSRFRLQYDDGPHDAETLLVQPRTGQVYVVTKEADGGGIYEAPNPLSDSGTNPLHRIGDAPAGVTDGAFLPDGSGVVLRTYTRAYLLDWPSGKVRRTLPLPAQPQGESLAVDTGGKRILVGSEGRGSQVFAVPLTGPTAAPSPTSTGSSGSSGAAAPEPTPSMTTIIRRAPGGSALMFVGLRWWVPAGALAVAALAGILAYPRGRRS